MNCSRCNKEPGTATVLYEKVGALMPVCFGCVTDEEWHSVNHTKSPIFKSQEMPTVPFYGKSQVEKILPLQDELSKAGMVAGPMEDNLERLREEMKHWAYSKDYSHPPKDWHRAVGTDWGNPSMTPSHFCTIRNEQIKEDELHMHSHFPDGRPRRDKIVNLEVSSAGGPIESGLPTPSAPSIAFPAMVDRQDSWGIYGAEAVRGREPYGSVGPHYRLAETWTCDNHPPGFEVKDIPKGEKCPICR